MSDVSRETGHLVIRPGYLSAILPLIRETGGRAIFRTIDECEASDACEFDQTCPHYLSCRTAVETDHEEGNCGTWEPPCPVCEEEQE